MFGHVLDGWPMTIAQMSDWAERERTLEECALGLRVLNTRYHISIRRKGPDDE